MNNRDWYKLSVDEVMGFLKTSASGLTSQEAKSLLLKFGPNKIKEEKKKPVWLLLLSQFKNFLVVILIAAAIIAIFIGEYIEAIAIMAIVVLAGLLGFIQEYRAEKTLEALKKMAALKATVIRDGQEKELKAEDLVPGDIISFKVGDRVSADSRLIEAIAMKTDEASLTGESETVDKTTQVLQDIEVPIGDRKNMAFMGTNVAYGRGKAVVVATGMETEFGKIAQMLQKVEEQRTPLQISIDRTAKWIGMMAIILSGVIGLAGIIRGYLIPEMFIWAVALAVAIVPEALPAVMVITLAIGVHRMAKRNALIRKLQAVETLGSTSIICSDKTGTLTENQMAVRKAWVNNYFIEFEDIGKESKDAALGKLLTISVLCNDSQLYGTKEGWTIKGDPTEGALLVAAVKAGINLEEIRNSFPRNDELPFSSERKRMTTIHKTDSGIIAYSKGAPEVILDSCSYIYEDGKEKEITRGDKENILRCAQEMGSSALRVLGMSYRLLNNYPFKEIESEMVFMGLLGMIDPPRKEVKEAVEVCFEAGIKPIMITGDHRLTAETIAKDLGILKSGRTLSGTELDALTEEEFERTVEQVEVYARVSPGHKLRIIEAFAKRGRVVAMTGDGVNDAPALKRADISIAMGITGTDVSKEASDMILLDDNFASIVHAAEEGRTIFANIRKFLTYLLCDNLGAVFAYCISILIGLPLPLTALQILFINLIMDGPKAIALGLEPAEPGIMRQPPRQHKANILNRSSLFYILGVGFWICVVTLGIFIWSLKEGKLYAMTMFFAGLIIVRTFNAFNCRSATISLFKLGLLTNRWLILVLFITIITTLPIIYVPFLQKVFKVVPISLGDWAILILVGSTTLIFVEIIKFLRTLRKSKKQRR